MRTTFAATALIFSVTAAVAQDAVTEDGQAIFDALGLGEMLGVMRQEGIVYGADIGADLLEGRGTAEWTALVSDIYAVDRMQDIVLTTLSAELEGKDVAGMLSFFESDLGQEIIGYELAAREALLDDAVDEASKEVAAIASADQTPRYLQVERFVDVNDLIETNVVGAMNANYAFYIGLMQGGALPVELTEEQVLADVWAQEPEIRQNTTEWVYGFLMLAYQPLDDDELEAYITFSDSDAGQELNRALFEAFDVMFEDISRALGFGSARFMSGEDI